MQSTCVGLGLIVFLVASGCSPTQEAGTYVSREAPEEVVSKHIGQIKGALALYFGDPQSPRHMLPDERAAADGEGGVPLVDTVDRQRLRLGQSVYSRKCATCHGVTGDGNGPAAPYLNPKPRDYRLGRFKFTSMPRGVKPRRSDLIRTVRYGAKGTSMPAFRWLPEEELQPLIDYVILLSQRGELELRLLEEAELELLEEDDLDPEIVAEYATDVAASWKLALEHVVLPVSQRPAYSDESIRMGRQAFLSKDCAKCHGDDGRGHTQDNVGKDDWGNVTFAADLTSGMLHGGRRPIDVYRRIYAGINGTPMPSFASALAEEPDSVWHMTHYILSIVENRDVEGLSEIQAPPPEDTSTALPESGAVTPTPSADSQDDQA